MLTFRPSLPADATALTLSAADAGELELLHPGVNPAEVVGLSIAISPDECITALDSEGVVVSIFGMAPSGEGYAAPWMLSSETLKRDRRQVLQVARKVTAAWREDPRFKFNWIAKANKTAQRLIQSLGFIVVPSPNGDFDFFFLPNECVNP